MANVLIIDDDELMCDVLARAIGKEGHFVRFVHSLEEGRRTTWEEKWDVLFLDVLLPDGNGLDDMNNLRGAPSGPEVIILTGSGDAEGARMAIQSGAWDYIDKTSSMEQVMLSLDRALRFRKEKLRNNDLHNLKRDAIIGKSNALATCLDYLTQAAETDTTVLIQGETGTGKELFARAIHDNSHRAKENFVVVDCTALPENLIESMLFGHEKGAFTGADRQQEGLFKQADRGTLFLDEIGELPPIHQKAFLRILQEKRFRPIGAKNEVSSDFRLVAATNRNLDRMVQEGQFRQDLLFRLRAFVLLLPPLRERLNDTEDIVRYHAPRICKKLGRPVPDLAPDFLAALRNFAWPGNVRELLNALERSIITARGETRLHINHLPPDIRVQMTRGDKEFYHAQAPLSKKEKAKPTPPLLPPLKEYLAQYEKKYLEDLLRETNGKVTEAARIAGLSRARFYAHLRKHGLSAADIRESTP